MKSKHGFETTLERSDLMRKIKGTNTRSEIKLRKALWALGIRYRINVSKLPGKPDIVIRKSKLVIFVDGEFWHGYEWRTKKTKIKANREYWIPKIERNMDRDRENNRLLRKQGMIVLRFWEHEIRKDLDACIGKILSYI